MTFACYYSLDRQEVPSLPFDESSSFAPPPAFGPYRVLHQIGSGVLGPVFRTYDPQRDRLVAVKAFRLDLVPEDVARLADALRRLVTTQAQMPPAANVAALNEGGLEGTVAFLAMDYIAAETLDVALRHLAPAPLETALPILSGIAAAIDAAWAAGSADTSLGHGALHPRDVFVTPGTDELRVTGFGIAPALESIGAKPPIRRPYTAPERAAGGTWDIRADVYSLGAIAHELLTGRRPAGPGEQDGSLPASLAPEARVHIRRVLSAALAEHPSHRFESAAKFIEALKDKSAELPIVHPGADVPGADVPLVNVTPPSADEFDLTSVISESSRPAATAAALPPPAPSRRRASRTVTPVANAPEPPAPEPAPVRLVPPAVESSSSPYAYVPELIDRAAVHTNAPGLSLPPPFPWAAMAAVLVAGLVVGAVAEHQLGLLRNAPAGAPNRAVTGKPATPPPGAKPATSASDTEVAIADPNQPAAKPPEPGGKPPEPAAKSPARSASAPKRPGRLLIQTVPSGATVTVDGKPAGRSPATVRDLLVGMHVVAVSLPGYVTGTRRLPLTAKAPSQRVVMTLKAARPVAPAATTGSIVIESRPRGATVMIDGKSVGVTPLRVPGFSPGLHRVQLTLAGHTPLSTVVSVKAGEAARLAVTLERK